MTHKKHTTLRRQSHTKRIKKVTKRRMTTWDSVLTKKSVTWDTGLNQMMEEQ